MVRQCGLSHKSMRSPLVSDFLRYRYKLISGGGAITIVMVWSWAFISDYFQTRWLVVMAQAVIGFIPSIILAIWNVPLGAKYFACKHNQCEVRYGLTQTGFATYLSLATAPPIFAWMSDLSPHDAEQRAFVLGFSIAFYYAVGEHPLPTVNFSVLTPAKGRGPMSSSGQRAKSPIIAWRGNAQSPFGHWSSFFSAH